MFPYALLIVFFMCALCCSCCRSNKSFTKLHVRAGSSGAGQVQFCLRNAEKCCLRNSEKSVSETRKSFGISTRRPRGAGRGKLLAPSLRSIPAARPLNYKCCMRSLACNVRSCFGEVRGVQPPLPVQRHRHQLEPKWCLLGAQHLSHLLRLGMLSGTGCHFFTRCNA